MSKFFSFFLLITMLNAQESSKNFIFTIQSGIGTNKLLVREKSSTTIVETKSKFGKNFSLGAQIQFSKYKEIKFITGAEIKWNQLYNVIDNIIISVANGSEMQSTVITDSYELIFLGLPLIINYKLDDKYELGIGGSYDLLLRAKFTKKIINNADPILLRQTNKIDPAQYSLLLQGKYSFNHKHAIVPTLILSPHRTSAVLFSSNATGPAWNFNLLYQFSL